MQLEPTGQVKGSLAAFLRPIETELERVEKEIHRVLRDENPLITEISTHLLKGGGKRIRPALVLLSGSIFGVRGRVLETVSAAVELIHMATLVHDDSIDRATVRRGVATINARWGDEVSILMGDYLFSKSFSLLAQTGDNPVVRIMADVVFRMCGGEIEQLTQSYNLEQREEEYLRRIDKKTAYFIGESCRLGAVVGGASPEEESALRDFGFGIGMGYQVVDDILDFTASESRLGKPIGSDLRGGVLTLPVIFALSKAPERDRLEELIGQRRFGQAEMREIYQILRDCDAFGYAAEVARRYTEEAKDRLRVLPTSRGRIALTGIADSLITREF